MAWFSEIESERVANIVAEVTSSREQRQLFQHVLTVRADGDGQGTRHSV
jgi:hypothetical protein